VSHDQGGALGLGNHMRHGEGLATSRDAEQNLRRIAALDAATSSSMARGWSPVGTRSVFSLNGVGMTVSRQISRAR